MKGGSLSFNFPNAQSPVGSGPLARLHRRGLAYVCTELAAPVAAWAGEGERCGHHLGESMHRNSVGRREPVML